jgi:hypothetical protein
VPVHCEELEPRCQPSVTPFFFSAGAPDGRIGSLSEPDNTHNNNDELETADDFVLPTQTELDQTTFTGLLTGGAQVSDISNVFIEIYQVFPKDSNSTRTPSVPTRVNSPGDVAFVERDSLENKLSFTTTVLSSSFAVANSVASTSQIAVGGASTPTPISGAEVQFNVAFTPPLDLAPGQYFFVPHVGLNATAPTGSDFLWLSAPLPIEPPGTAFTPDLQAWERDNALKPDWLRLGADIVGGTTFNESFSLTGVSFAASLSSLTPNSVAAGSGDLALTVDGSEFTNQSTVLFNGLPLATTFVNSGKLQATIPAALLADIGTANVTVIDVQRGLSNAQTFSIAADGDVDVNGTAGNDTLTITLTTGTTGAFTYVLNGAAPVNLKGVTSLSFNGLGGTDTLVIDAGGRAAVSTPGRFTIAGQPPIIYSDVEIVQFNNTAAVDSLAGPDTADRIALTGLSGNRRFVASLYLDILGRPASTAEISAWENVLNATGSRAQAIAGIDHSPEARTHLVRSWYVQYLGWAAFNGEEQVWVNALLNGQPEDQVLSGILSSPEFFGRAQSLVSTASTPNERYVQALFTLILGRATDPAGLAFWVSKIGSQGLGGVARAIYDSHEARIDVIDAIYDTLLHRPADSTGLNAWFISNLDFAGIREAIESSDEFFTNG